MIRDRRPAVFLVGLLAMSAPYASIGQAPIGGGHRLAWTQAATVAEIAAMSFAIVVDGTRGTLPPASCLADATPNSFTCSVPFPAMTPGLHTVEVIAIQTSGASTFESAKSAPLGVQFFLVTTPSNLRAIPPPAKAP